MFKNQIKRTFLLSLPIIIGQLGQMLMSVVDTVMVGKVGVEALAAASLANAIFNVIMIVGFGLTMAVTPLTAIAYGAGKDKECGVILRQGLLLNIFAGVVLCTVTLILSGTLHFLQQPEEIVNSASIYMQLLGLSMLPLMLFQTYRQFAEGVSFLKPAMIIMILANIINIFANWVFIYGHLGIEPLGLTGAGIATICSRIFMAATLMIVIKKSLRMKRFDPTLNYRKINFPMMRHLIEIGVPTSFQYFFEVSAFAASSIMVGWMGTISLAAHHIALNLASIPYMVAMGISSAATIRVSMAVGRKDIPGIRAAGFSATLFCAVFMALSGIFFIIFRLYLPSLYISDQQVIDISSTLLVIVAFFQISDGTQAVGLGSLRGITDMKIPTFITLAAYWLIGLPSGYFLAFKCNMGIHGIWYGLLISLTASACFMMIRFNLKTKIN